MGEKILRGDLTITDTAVINKIGYNTLENVPHFHYDSQPLLVVGSTNDMSALENVAAIRRCVRKTVEDKPW